MSSVTNGHQRLRATLVLLIAIAVIIAVFGVMYTRSERSELEDASADDLRATVTRYNELLSWGYANLDMNRLTEVASAEQARQEYYHMAALGEGGVKLMADLESIEFEEISVEATSASVVTREVWSYTQVPADGGAPIARNRVRYDLRYDLEQQQSGHWLITSVTAFDSEELSVEESTLPTNAVPLDRPPGMPQGAESTASP